MSKDIYIGTRVSQDLIFQISNYMSLNPSLTQSDIVRIAIEEFFENKDENFLNKKINKHKNILENLENMKKIIKLKTKNIKKIPKNEIDFLLESKDKIGENPFYIEGRIKSYLNIFKKPFKISKQEFFKLIFEAEKQCKK